MTKNGRPEIESGRPFRLASLVRDADPDRYLSVLFAPAAQRDSLLALYAFNFEIAKTAEIVSEPTLGLVRLQWWRETIEEIYHGQPRQHEVALALAKVVEAAQLPRASFNALIDAREQDLASAPFATPGELQNYADATSGHLMRLAARILGADAALDEAAGPLGIAYALTGLLRALPFHAARRRLMFPVDQVHTAGLTVEEVFAGGVASLRPLLATIAAGARETLSAAPRLDVPRGCLAAVLPAALVSPYLELMARPNFDPYRDRTDLSILRRQWAMLRAMIRKRI